VIEQKTYFHFIPFVILYFFFNNVFLPQGLLYTTLLSPVFLYYLYKNDKIKNMLKWTLVLLIPIPFHIITGFDIKSYLISSSLVFSAWIFLFTSMEAVKKTNNNLDKIFLKVLLLNSVLVLIALIFLPLTPLQSLLWDSIPISHGIESFPRLKLLAYEPSHYALLLSPVFIYYLIKVILGQTKHPLIILIGVGIPIILSLSFGVAGAIIIALLIGLLVFIKKIPSQTKKLFFSSLILIAITIILVGVLWPDNPVFIRLENIISGTDTSAKGRLFDSFNFAYNLLIQHDIWFGIGPGQIKILAHDLIINFYNYMGEFAETVRIPNSMGEMLAIYGLYGFLLKIFFEIYFFIRFKVYNNIYSLSLFAFIFIYQFTGSFLINIAEIGIWVLVFHAKFEQFDSERVNVHVE